MDRIFINIPSYCDPEIWETVENFYSNAKYPERVYFGITHQTEDFSFHEEMSLKFSNVKMKIITPGSIVGCQPARISSHKFYNEEEYYLNMDSHMRSIKNWDEELISDFKSLEINNGPSVITAYVAAYDKDNNGEDIINDVSYSTSFYMQDYNREHFSKFGIPQFCAYNQEHGKEVPSPYVSGHFFFTSRQAIIDAPFVREVMFTEEEIFMAVRFYTAGYNLYNPKKTYVYHRYGRGGRRLFWEDFPELWYPNDEASRNFVNNILTNNIVNDKNGIMSKRTLQDFESYSGLNFSRRTFDDSVIKSYINLQ